MATQSKKMGTVDSLYALTAGNATPAKRNRASMGGPSHAHAPTSSPASMGQATPHRQTAQSSRLASSPAYNNGDSPSMRAPNTPQTPATPAAPTVPFAERQDAGKVLESLNSHLEMIDPESVAGGAASRVTLSSTRSLSDYKYRIAYERAMERSEVLDAAIDEAAEQLRDWYGIEEFGDPGLQSQEEGIFVGRLCPESDSLKMSETTVHLESSRMLGSGSRVLLKFEPDMQVRGAPPGAGGVGFFPGEIVGIRGRNGGGKLLAVKEVLMLPPPEASYTAPSDLLRFDHGAGKGQLAGAPMGVVCAAGPFTLDTNLDYEPLAALLEQAASDRPDVLILLGPFVDAQHPLILAADVDQTPSQIFKSQIASRLSNFVQQSSRTSVILVPSGRDLISVHTAYPQAPLPKEELQAMGLPKAVKLLPNPTTFSINEVVFAVTSVDTLFHLRNQEFFRKCAEVADPNAPAPDAVEKEDVMARTCRYLLRQKSFYPIFPAPLPSKVIDPPLLDITHNELVRMGQSGADVVIVPSMIKSFAKLVDSTVILNPSFLMRGSTPGTYAKMAVHPLEKSELERRTREGDEGGAADEPIEHRVWERCRVDIVKV